MPLPQDRAAVHSLPSFAQAFSSLSGSDDRALPPIHGHHHHHHSSHRDRDTHHAGRSPPVHGAHPRPAQHGSHHHHHHRPAPPSSKQPGQTQSVLKKRPRAASTYEADGSSERSRSPPRLDIVKKEVDFDQLDPSPTPSPPTPPPVLSRKASHNDLATIVANNNHTTIGGGGAPAPSLARPTPPSKRRRVTISGVAHPLNTANLPPPDPSPALHTPTHSQPLGPGSTPISPVVMGFTVQRDDPSAIESLRSMISVKQKQKALIESRRGSVAGIAGIDAARRGSTAGIVNDGRRGSVPALLPVPPVTPSVNIVNPTPTSATAPAPGGAPKRSGPSPNGASRLGGRSPPTGMSIPSNVTRSPSNRASSALNGTKGAPSASPAGIRALSPASHVVPSQNNPTRPPPTSAASTGSTVVSTLNRSPPSQHQLAGPGQGASSHLQNTQSVQSSQNTSSSSQPASQAQTSNQTLSQPMGQPPQNTNPQPPSQSQQQSQSQQHQQSQQQVQLVANQGLSALANNLPPPPNSFARRRAGQLGMRGNKPADIVISPRDSDGAPTPSSSKAGQQTPAPSANYKAMLPAIQSAPAVPRPGQQAGRFPMALPSLPPALGQRGLALRRAPGQVPPTPTRLSMQRAQGGIAESTSVRLSQPTGGVPATAGLAPPHAHSHSQSLSLGAPGAMPVTPATLHHAAHGAPVPGDKAAFLAPFEQFYDALSDAQVLKNWFGEQLRRVGRAVRDVEEQKAELDRARVELNQQREAAGGGSGSGLNVSGIGRGELERLVADAVQREAHGWRDEVTRLRTRVMELEDTLYGPRPPPESPEMSRLKGKGPPKPTNGILAAGPGALRGPPPSQGTQPGYPTAPGPDSYTFPPVQRPPSLPTLPPPPSAATETTRRSASPLPLPSPMRPGAPAASGGEASGPEPPATARSMSRSAASSPAPSFDSGVGRRLSVSAMRYEPPPPSRAAPTASASPADEKKDKDAMGRKDEVKARVTTSPQLKPEAKRHNSQSSVASLKGDKSEDRPGHVRHPSNGRRSPLPSASTPKRPPSPMDET